MKLELKHLAPYLPYELKAKYHMLIDIKKKFDETTILNVTNIKWIITGTHHKVILHPLSDLTKEIKHDGEKFVPYNKLFNFKGIGYKDPIININWLNKQYYEVWQKLFEWHFDVFNLIEQNLAITKNQNN